MKTRVHLLAFLAVSFGGSAWADEVITVPPNCTVGPIEVKLRHTENSKVTFQVNRDGKWLDDGGTGVLENKETKTYKPKYPKLWASSPRGFQIKVGGQFSTGSWHRWETSADYPATKITPDHAVVYLFSGKHEDANTTVTIPFAGRCIKSGPK